jgi:hypothetical protein
MRTFAILLLGIFLIASPQTVEGQSVKRLYKVFVPYQWEIYNTIYKRRYWDRRDNYDYVQFKPDGTFKRRYQGTDMSGKWTYNRRKKMVTLKVKKPFTKTITFKIKKLSNKTLVYKSSEENYKVTMYLKKGAIPTRPKRPKKRGKRKN